MFLSLVPELDFNRVMIVFDDKGLDPSLLTGIPFVKERLHIRHSDRSP